jgi:putative inorganic carbon (HCO3(-)) transporter
MNIGFSRTVDKVQFFGLLIATLVVPLVFFIGQQNTIIFNILRIVFSPALIAQGNQNIVLFKPLLAQLIMYFLFTLWLIEGLENNKFELVPDALNIPLVLWTFWLVFTTLFISNFWYYSVEELGRYLAMFLLFFIVQKVINSKARLKWILWVLFAVCGWATVLGLLQHLNMPIYQWGRDSAPVVSTFGNKNFLAGFLLTTLPVIIGYILATRKWLISLILIPLASIQFYVLLATETRTGFLGFLVAMATFLILTLRFIWRKQQIKFNKKTVFIMLLVLLAIVGIVYQLMPEGLVRNLLSVVDIQHGTQRVRWIMWTGSSRAALDKPLTGHGHGAFQLVFPNYRPRFYHRFRVSHNTRHSHNEYMEVLMETGLIGLTFFLGILVVFGTVVYRFLQRNRSSFYRWLLIGMASSVVGVLAQNMASVNIRWMSSTFSFWLVIALASASIRIASRDAGKAKKPGKTALVGKYSFMPRFSWKTPVYLLLIFIFCSIGYGFFRIVLADFKLKRMNSMIIMAEAGDPSWEKAARVGEDALRYNPYSLSTRYKLGYVYLGQKKYKEAQKMYDYLTDLAPNYAQIHNNIALINRNLNNPHKSSLHFEWATRLEDNLRNHLNLIRNYNGKDMPERKLYHGLYLPRIGLENRLNNRHLQYCSIRERNLNGVEQRNKEIQSDREQVLNIMQYLEPDWRKKNIPLADLTVLQYSLQGPVEPATYRRYRDLLKNNFNNPLPVLGLVGRLRDSGDRKTQVFRQEYLKIFQKKVQEDERWLLVVADLLAQQGRAEEAVKLLEGIPEELTETPRYREIVDYIKGQTGN